MTELKYCAYLFPYGQRHLFVTQHILGLDTDIYTHYKDIQLSRYKANVSDKSTCNTYVERLTLTIDAFFITMLVANLFFRPIRTCFIVHEDNQDTGVWKHCGIWNYGAVYMLYTNMLIIHLLSIFTIKTPRALAAFRPLNREDADKSTLTITYWLLSASIPEHKNTYYCNGSVILKC